MDNLPYYIENFWDFTDPFVIFWQSIFRLPDDMMRLSICLIATYIGAIIHRYFIKQTNIRYLFSLCVGLFWLFFCFKWDALYYVISGTITYVICLIFPVKYVPKIVLVVSFGVLAYGHWMRFYYAYLVYTVNWVTPFMLFVIKLQTFAWNYHDGQYPPSKFIPIKNRIEKLPSLLEYYSWLFFFAGLLTGPVGEFNDYKAFTDRSLFKDEPKGEIPDSKKAAFNKFCWMFLGIFGFYGAKLIPESYCGTLEFLENPFWYRMIYVLFAVEMGFTKYYFAWFNGEAHTILIGAGYNGRSKSGKILWNRMLMLHLIPFRLANCRFMIAQNWNICSSDWLKYYIYLRIPAKLQKLLHPVVLTMMVSAFWHGFYPGYYLFFAGYAFYYLVEEVIDYKFKRRFIVTGRGRDIKPISPLRYKIYICFATLCTWIYINSITISFRLLDWKRTKIVWGGIYYWPMIVSIILYLVFKYIIPPIPKPKPEEKKE